MSISLLLLCSNLLRPFESLCSSVQGATRRAKGKTSRHEVATKSIPLFPPQRAVISLLFFFVAEREGFVQSVASRATCLRVAIVCCRK